MSSEVSIPYKPHSATLVVVDEANAIIDEYLAQDFKLTLRQLTNTSGSDSCAH